MANRNNISKANIKSYLKGQSIQTKLQHNKMKLAALTKKLRTRKSNRERYKNNCQYHHNQKAFYSGLRMGGEGVKQVDDPPSTEEVKEFWENLYSDKGRHREDAEWLKKEEEEMENVVTAKWQDLTESDLLKGCKRLANWKSPGLDQVQNFWLKYLTALQPKLTEIINHIVKNPTIAPKWFTRGRTTLLYKTGPTSKAKNYRPITCLPTYYKLTTLMLTNKIYTHVIENDILSVE